MRARVPTGIGAISSKKRRNLLFVGTNSLGIILFVSHALVQAISAPLLHISFSLASQNKSVNDKGNRAQLTVLVSIRIMHFRFPGRITTCCFVCRPC